MEQDLPYIPNEIVDLIASFAKGSAGLTFSQSSTHYYKLLNKNKIDYFKQYQLELIEQKHTILIEGQKYYGTINNYYCNDCCCLLKKPDSMLTHPLKCHKNKPLICEYCDSPKPFHKIRNKKDCVFRKFNCHHCKKRHAYVEHESNTCSERIISCNLCYKDYKQKVYNCHDCFYTCHSCGLKIPGKERHHHDFNCPEAKICCVYCYKTIKRKDHEQHIKNRCEVQCEECGQMVEPKKIKIHAYDCPEASINCGFCDEMYHPNKKNDPHHFICKSICFKCGCIYQGSHVCHPSIKRIYNPIKNGFCYDGHENL